MVYCCVTSIFVGEANIELTIFSLHFHHRKQLQTDKKIGAEFFSRRFSLMQGTILGQIDEELDDDVFAKLITAYFHTVNMLIWNSNCELDWASNSNFKAPGLKIQKGNCS